MRQIGRYTVTRELGRGAMGVVFEARDPLIGRPVAIKVIRLDSLGGTTDTNWLQERLFREARSAGALSHPGIVVVHDLGVHEDLAYIAMERVDGPTLEQVLASRQPDSRETLSILRQTAAALDCAHDSGVVHRDIKPSNLMLHKGTTVKVTDFGIAKITDTEHRTRTGMVLGTPSYMSPEQITAQPIDGRSDQFSLAVIAYEMLTRKRPFTAEQLAGLVHQIVYEERPSARAARPDLPEAVDEVLKKGLAKDAADRYPTCQSFVEALAAALTGVAATIDDTLDNTRISFRKAFDIDTSLASPLENLTVTRTLRQSPPISLEASMAKAEAGTAPAFAALRLDSQNFWTPGRMAGAGGILLAIVLVAAGLTKYYQTSGPPPKPVLPPPIDLPVVPPVKPVSKPGISSFTADRVSIVAGQSVTLKWSVTNATEVRIEPGIGSVALRGSREVPVSSNTTFALIAKGAGGDVTRRVAITVTPAAPNVTFTSDLDSIKVGQTADLRWSVPTATEVLIDQVGRVAGEGSQRVSPAKTTSYKLTAKGAWGELTRSVTVSVEASMGEARQAWNARDWARVRSIAEGGNAEGQFYLGQMYTAGQGVTRDDTQASAWYRKAADQNYPAGQFYLGLAHLNGAGVARDDTQAIALFRKSADQGYMLAQNMLGSLYQNGRGVPRDDAQAMAWYRKAADQNYAIAQNSLGYIYAAGRGVPQDYAQAAVWYTKAANLGFVAAQVTIGDMYRDGRGVPQDDFQAASWYRKAADRDNFGAQYSLGTMYENGRGVTKDVTQAIAWYRKAANQRGGKAGSLPAVEALKRLGATQ